MPHGFDQVTVAQVAAAAGVGFATDGFTTLSGALYLVYFGELYPLRPDAIAYLGDMFRPFPGGADSWGGPTLIGAWFIHGMVAVALQAVGLALIRGLGALCGRITRPLLGQ